MSTGTISANPAIPPVRRRSSNVSSPDEVIRPYFAHLQTIGNLAGFWIGLDGYGSGDVEQAGTEQDCYPYGRYEFTNYYAWTEIYTEQPGNQPIMNVNSGDAMTVWVWIGDADFDMDIAGRVVWFYLYDDTTGQVAFRHTALNDIVDSLTSAESIMERPLAPSNDFYVLSDYHQATMTDAYVLIEDGTWVGAEAASTIQLTMYNDYYVGFDNNKLPSASFTGPTSMTYDWNNYD